MTTIYTTFQPAEAHVIASRLEASGYHPEVLNEMAALATDGYSLATGGIHVAVPEEEAVEARALIDAASQPQPE